MYTQAMLYTIFPAVATGAALVWLRLKHLQRVLRHMRNALNTCRAAVLANMTQVDQDKADGSAIALMAASELKHVYRFRDVRQVSKLRYWRVCTHTHEGSGTPCQAFLV